MHANVDHKPAMKGFEMLQGNAYDFSIVQIRGNVQSVSMRVPDMSLPMAV
jgi:hypothetical protein